MAGKMLSVEPTIDPSAKLHDTRLGAYCEVGARTILHEVTLDDYSYVVNDAQITYTTIGKFCSIAAMTRINPGCRYSPAQALLPQGFPCWSSLAGRGRSPSSPRACHRSGPRSRGPRPPAGPRCGRQSCGTRCGS